MQICKLAPALFPIRQRTKTAAAERFGDGIKIMKYYKLVLLAVGWFCLSAAISLAGEAGPAKPSPTDKCPVCGMFVAKYPDFVARISFKDGSYAFFDGVKDMMKYYFNLAKYNPAKQLGEIESSR